MDGVLVDNMRIHARAYDIFYERHGVGNRQNVLKELSGLGNDEIMQRLFTPERLAELGGWRALSEEKEAIYREIYAPEIRPVEGLRELLGRLRTAGVRCAVGSSGCRANVDFVLERCGIGDFFDARISGDTVTRCKPDPEIYLRAAAALGADPADCVVFEDALAGIEAARRAGAGRIVALATTLTREQLLAEGGADAVVGSFAEVTDADLN